MIKVSYFQAISSERIPQILPVLNTNTDEIFEKLAAPTLLPSVAKFIADIKPQNDVQYVLFNALGAAEYFGCFPEGTQVRTSKGSVSIEQIKIGDLVVTHRNRLRAVQAVLPRESQELCDLRLVGHPRNVPVFSATPNHEVFAVRRSDFIKAKRAIVWAERGASSLSARRSKLARSLSFSWVPIAELGKGDIVAEPFPLDENVSGLGTELLCSEDFAYLLGWYAAEGCLTYRYDREDESPCGIVLVVSSEETHVLKRITDIAARHGHKVFAKFSDVAASLRIELHWKELADLCVNNIGTPSTHKFLSEGLLHMPRWWQEIFLQAYAEGDGCVDKSKKSFRSVRCVSASLQLLLGIRILAARLGLLSSVSGRHNTKSNWYTGKPIYTLLIGGQQFLGKDSPCKNYLHPDGFILSPVASVVRRSDRCAVYDLTVAEDSSYTAGGVVVHNSNSNADGFAEEALKYCPDNWTGTPIVDRALAKDWPYGFPTFYNANVYVHHRNQDKTRSVGEIEMCAWNDAMKRVELVLAVYKERCLKFGGQGAWDRLHKGELIDGSMGSRVPFDTCQIHTDRALYKKAWATFDSKKHKHPGQAILEFHKKLKEENGIGIPGLAITRKEYCQEMRVSPNKVLQDGSKVFVDNDFPNFFDYSLVFIGADRTAKGMLKVAEKKIWTGISSADLAVEFGYPEEDDVKTAGIKNAKQNKRAEILKNVLPVPAAAKAVPILTRQEEDIPSPVLDRLATRPLKSLFSTLAHLGILLRPREFQRVILVRSGKKDLANSLSKAGIVFPKEDGPSLSLPDTIDDMVSGLLGPFEEGRSLFGPKIEKRVTMIFINGPKEEKKTSSPTSEALRKIGSAYTSYRLGMTDLLSAPQTFLSEKELDKYACSGESLLTPLSRYYLENAFWDEVGYNGSPASANVEKGIPFGEHVVTK